MFYSTPAKLGTLRFFPPRPEYAEIFCERWFPVKRGVRQGCILSPPIFSMYTETILRKVEADGELTSFNAVKMHGKEVKELRYADDTVLFAQKLEGLRRLLQSVNCI